MTTVVNLVSWASWAFWASLSSYSQKSRPKQKKTGWPDNFSDYCSQVDSSKNAFLCPFMDLINHSSAPNCYYETGLQTGSSKLSSFFRYGNRRLCSPSRSRATAEWGAVYHLRREQVWPRATCILWLLPSARCQPQLVHRLLSQFYRPEFTFRKPT